MKKKRKYTLKMNLDSMKIIWFNIEKKVVKNSSKEM